MTIQVKEALARALEAGRPPFFYLDTDAIRDLIKGRKRSAADTIIEKLEELTAADFACVLLTPDDEGCKKGCSPETQPQARQNVVLEMDMVLARLGRKHVAILQKGRELERPSDIDGLIYIPFEAHVNETKNHLAGTLQEAGFDIQVKDLLP